ncbi:MAG: type II secretion system F family protein [Arcobacter sp.]|nr:type II secretion system F family protein [Arcobacter sp.]
MKSKNKFQDALSYAKNTTNNIFIEEQIGLIIQDLNDGKSISEAFTNRNLFDEITLRMLIVGENTNRLEYILEDLQNINKKQLTKHNEDFIAFLTPFFVVVVAGIILWLVLAIMTPIWELGSFIK